MILPGQVSQNIQPNNMIIISKFSNDKLCFGLSSYEFHCKCNFDACRFTIINPRLLEVYEKFRERINMPLTINSGYRCQAHHFHNVYNDDVQTLTASRHPTGEAIDISIINLLEKIELHAIIEAARHAGFTFIKHYEDEKFLHCDVR